MKGRQRMRLDSVKAGTLVATLLIAVLAHTTDQAVLAGLLLLLGVPHGAADHLLHNVTAGERARGPGAFARFYLVAMTVYTLLWAGAPSAAFAVFIELSVYHFGQTQPGSLTDQLIWGVFYLGFPVTYHYAEAAPIVAGMLGHPLPDPGRWIEWVPWSLALAALANAVYRRRFDLVTDLAVLSLMYVSTGLLLGFAVFFLFWHSLPSALAEYAFLRSRLRPAHWREFVRYLLPMSVAAAAFLWVAHAWLFVPGAPVLPLSRAFVLLSIITLPHAILVDRIYRPAA